MTTMRDSVDEEVLFGFLEDEDNSDPSLLLGSETTGDSNNNDLVAIEDISTLSDSQEKTLSMLSVISAMLSICGSFVIVIRVLGHKRLQQKVTPYHRIMLALSLCDISASTTFALSPFLAPASTSQRVWAIGNDATCSFHGFLSQFSFSAVAYNFWLALYYLLTIRFGMKRQVFARRYEPWIHVGTFIYFFGTAISGVIVGFYGEVELGMGCYIKQFPDDVSRQEAASVIS